MAPLGHALDTGAVGDNARDDSPSARPALAGPLDGPKTPPQALQQPAAPHRKPHDQQ